MSIEVKNLTKTYGTQNAVDNVSFKLQPGEIVGFLGPNGAGKTTTMKIITSYISPSKGDAYVSGIDVAEHPLKARKLIGYLPEHNPLYDGMYVREFLRFVARLHDLKERDKHVDRVVELTGLKKEQHKHVRALSKGYRQRLGLAQALIHDPEVLILDEPTSGLDPNQLVEIREVIRSIGKDKTILFSSHIMQEIEALCERVIIIHEGKIVADGDIEQLDTRNRNQETVVLLEIDDGVNEEFLTRIPNVSHVVKKQKNLFHVYGESKPDLRADIYDYMKQSQYRILEMQRVRKHVEDVFQSLTKNQK